MSVERRSLLTLLAGGVGLGIIGGIGGGQTTDDDVATDSTLYENGTATDAGTGEKRWSVAEFEPSEVSGSSIVVDGTLYFAVTKPEDPDHFRPKDAGIAAVDAVSGDLD